MLTVVLWQWGARYSMEHVAKMRSMLERCLSLPHRVVCITDRPNDVPHGVEAFDIRHTIGRGDTKNLRRLWLYRGDPQKPGKMWPGLLGDRLLQFDIDVVLTGDITPLVDRPDPFVIWKSDSTRRPTRPHGWAYNPTMLLMTVGARRDVYDRYVANPKGVIKAANAAGWDVNVNSDQGVASLILHENPPPVWTTDDGIHAYRSVAGKFGMSDRGLPAGCRVVSFHGRSGSRTPADPVLQERSPWILEHWR